MSYFKFRQNNSFGHFVTELRWYLFRQIMPPMLTAIAQQNGVYFNGVADGVDCDCCGDRWYPVQRRRRTGISHRHMVMVVVLLFTVTAIITWTTQWKKLGCKSNHQKIVFWACKSFYAMVQS